MKDAAESLLAFTIDAEPDWGLTGTEAVRIVLPRLLDLLSKHRARATFFVVSDLLDDCAEVLSQAVAEHEIASHGVSHRCLHRLPPDEVREELTASRRRLCQELGADVVGFRAPFLRVPPGWSDLLTQAGYRYDSSVGRVYPSPRNVPPWRRRPRPLGEAVLLPTTTWKVGLVPFSLTYLRLSAPLGERMLPPGGVFYLHPHELAPLSLAKGLSAPLKWALRCNVGEPAWRILDRLLERWQGRTVTCRTLLERYGYSM